MKRIFTLILLAGAMLAGSANAQTKTEDDERWISAARSLDHETELYIDAQTMRRDGDTLLIWEKFLNRSGEYYLCRAQIRRDRQYRFLSGGLYDVKGKVISSSYIPTEWEEARPESLQEFVNKYFDGLMKLVAPKDTPTVRY